MSITATVPPSLLENENHAHKRRTSSTALGRSTTPRPVSPVKPEHQTLSRPPVTPLVHVPATTSMGIESPTVRANIPRDRRAFSFPAVQAPPPKPISIARRREMRQSGTHGVSGAMALPFARKTMGVSLTSSPAMNSPAKEVPNGALRAPVRRDLLRATKSTGGANTPMDPESVFCSTSESEDETDHIPRASPLKLMSVPLSALTSTGPSSMPLSQRPAKHRTSHAAPSSQTSFTLAQSDVFGRKSSQSPVAQMVASSASSRSREDIISWAKAVGLRPREGETSEDGEEERGRSRTRRTEGLPSFTPLSEPEALPEDHAGTTPKGVIGSALAGLSLTGLRVGPIVKALTSTISPHSPQLPTVSPALGLHTGSASTHVSTVEVMSTPGGVPINNNNSCHESDAPPLHYGGATPTLSTASFSELVDPSVNGTFDHAEIATDDNRSTASYARRNTPPALPKQPTAANQPLPLRPITTTATALWNLSSYFRSLAPFSIASVIAPLTPFAAQDASKNPSGVTTPAPIPEEPAEEEAAQASSPLPASRYEDPRQTILPQEVVKSFPLDIAIPASDAGKEEQRAKIAEREVREYYDRSSSRHGRRSRSRSRSRCRGFSGPARSRSRSVDSDVARRHSRKISYDADESDDDEDERRGRSRRGKVLARDMPDRRAGDAIAPPSIAGRRLSEGGMRVLGDRSGSRGERGRR